MVPRIVLDSLCAGVRGHPFEMTSDERTVVTASLGLVITAIGAFLPWARIGGRNRSGFNTADTFIGLADGVLPDVIAWVGRWWYAPAFLVVIAWATTFVSGRRSTRIAGIVCTVIALAMWWLFIWAGSNWNVLNVKLLGPVVATLGLAAVAWACSRPRAGLLGTQR